MSSKGIARLFHIIALYNTSMFFAMLFWVSFMQSVEDYGHFKTKRAFMILKWTFRG